MADGSQATTVTDKPKVSNETEIKKLKPDSTKTLEAKPKNIDDDPNNGLKIKTETRGTNILWIVRKARKC